MSRLLEGKNCLVSGGSRGIGRAIVQRFASEGAKVYYLARKEAEGGFELSEGSIAPVYIACDLGSSEQIDAALKTVETEAGGIDVLVNNAGINKDGLVFRMSLDDWNAVLSTNLTAAFLLCRGAARLMIKKRSGSIINISSVVALRGNGGQSNYVASKAGLIGFTKSLAREVASRGVRANALAPGFIDTDMTEKLPEAVKAKAIENIPLARAGTVEDVAAAALFLASDDSSYITGEVIRIDGGMGM